MYAVDIYSTGVCNLEIEVELLVQFSTRLLRVDKRKG